MNVLTRILKRDAAAEHQHHWHDQFTGELHCCGCPETSEDQGVPYQDAVECLRSDAESFAAWLPPARPLAAPASSKSRRRSRVAA